MSKTIDPGTPEARRAWLDSLPVGTVVVDGTGIRNTKQEGGWVEDGECKPMRGDVMHAWCQGESWMRGVWPALAVTLPQSSLHAVSLDIAEWQAATFGPPGDLLATVGKMADEVAELRAEVVRLPQDADAVREEAADVVFMLIDLMRSFGGPDALAAAMAAKLGKNKARAWTKGADGKWSGSK